MNRRQFLQRAGIAGAAVGGVAAGGVLMWTFALHHLEVVQQPLPIVGLPSGLEGAKLCHNPDVADHPVWAGYRGWMLSGHTHGGQCKVPFMTPPILPVRNKRYAAGAVSVGDERTVWRAV